jgi:glycosyltransferase involved in cell wall biosynthesis
MTKISVAMTVHNGFPFLQEQIDSILQQLGEQDELVISDDGSTDHSRAVIESYADKRIKLLPAMNFKNPVRNFEYVLEHCSYEIIFLADQDDVWLPGKVSSLLEILNSNDLVVCDCRVVDSDRNILHESFFKLNGSKKGLLMNLVRSSFMGCCMAFRRNVLERSLPFPDAVPMHDQWIGLVASRYFNVSFVHKPLVEHRRHQDNFSSTSDSSVNSFGQKMRNRFYLISQLLWR